MQGGRRPKIERAEQLPVHAYSVPGSVIAVLDDEALLLGLANKLAADLKKDLETYDIEDKATLRSYYISLAHVALVNGDFDEALGLVARAGALEEKPAAVELSGLMTNSVVAASRSTQDPKGAFEREMRARLARTHYDVVQSELKAMKGQAEMLTPNILMTVIREQLEPAAKSGAVSKDIAVALLQLNFVLKHEIPHRESIIECLKEVIDAHATSKPDIWRARDVDLVGEPGLVPVTMAVWDTGVDVSLFEGRLWTDPASDEDRYGIAMTWEGTRTQGPMRRLDASPEQVERGKKYAKGYMDTQYQVDSPEAAEVKAAMASLGPDQVKDFIESIIMYTTYGHGTHVAGILSAGNPAARMMTIRLEVPMTLAPPRIGPDFGAAKGREFETCVAYLNAHGARVVNMSWGFSPSELEQMLEYHHVGADQEERRKMAGAMFEAMRKPFLDAVSRTPGILFVAACGNANSDSRFEEFIPASFELPNVITVGAVDLAGDEAAFTSYGSSSVYANGYQVESLVPGGERQSWSGTSMAAPQVCNLAGKLLAKYPFLTTDQLKTLIMEGSEEKAVGKGRTIRLMDEKKSFELAAKVRPS